MAKFDPLKEYFLHLPEHQTDITLPFGQVEKIIGSELPPAAFKFRAYWGNNAGGGHVHARA
jgi:hypothetical protein